MEIIETVDTKATVKKKTVAKKLPVEVIPASLSLKRIRMLSLLL